MGQSLARMYVHAVFSTRNREPLLADPWRGEMFAVLGGIAGNLGCPSLIVGGMADHVHVLFELGRSISLSDALRGIKTNSSAWANHDRGLAGAFHWQAGYAAFSVSQSNVEAVREYIRRQDEHHARQSFQDELRAWLHKYGIAWDERYVWD